MLVWVISPAAAKKEEKLEYKGKTKENFDIQLDCT